MYQLGLKMWNNFHQKIKYKKINKFYCLFVYMYNVYHLNRIRCVCLPGLCSGGKSVGNCSVLHPRDNKSSPLLLFWCTTNCRTNRHVAAAARKATASVH